MDFINSVDKRRASSNGISRQNASANAGNPPPAQLGGGGTAAFRSSCLSCGCPIILTNPATTPICVQCQSGRQPGSAPFPPSPPPFILTSTGARSSPIPVGEIRLGEILAYRGWKERGGYLGSYSQSVIWPPGEPMEGKVSSKEHGAGVYVFKSKKLLFDFMQREVRSDSPLIFGTVAIWGDIVEHELGYRAQWAKVVSLDGEFPGGNNTAMVKRLRETYNLGGVA